MKKTIALLSFLAVIMFAPMMAQAEVANGFIYKNASEPLLGSGSVATTKNGQATCTSYFGIVAKGDCSVATAMKNGKVKTLSHADTYVKNILGYKKVTVKVYGN